MYIYIYIYIYIYRYIYIYGQNGNYNYPRTGNSPLFTRSTQRSCSTNALSKAQIYSVVWEIEIWPHALAGKSI